MLRFNAVLAAIAASLVIITLLFTGVISAAPFEELFNKNVKDHLRTKDGKRKVDTIVHLMMENRAFDHLLGSPSIANELGYKGLTGDEWNPISTLDPRSPRVYVGIDKSEPIADIDPHHETYAQTSKIFGMKNLLDRNYTESMMGFVEWEHNARKKQNLPNTSIFSVMNSFKKSDVISFFDLASSFSVFDRFFSAIPGCTWPNRLMAMAGSSYRLTETFFFYKDVNGQLFPQKTIFDQLEEEGLDWLIAVEGTLWESFVAKIAYNPQKVITFEEFRKRSNEGTLPAYVFVNPLGGVNLTAGTGARDCHPQHSIHECGSMVADTYEIVRNGKKWNSSMFIVSFDENGGYYDSVIPPSKNIPIPTAEDALGGLPDFYFKFDRLGIRIPFFVASPWIPKNTVVSEAPASEKPFNTSHYDLTSVIATVRKVLGMNSSNLTARDGWSSTFSHILSLDEPRTDCPTQLARVNRSAEERLTQAQLEAKQPINDLQRGMALQLHRLTDGIPSRTTGHPKELVTELDFAEWSMETWHNHKHHHALHQQGVANSEKLFRLVVDGILSVEAALLGEMKWNIINASACGHPGRWTISSRTLKDSSTKNPFCLTYNTTTGAIISQPCFPSADPCKVQNQNQVWSVGTKMTFSPIYDQALCMTTVMHPTNTPPVLSKCDAGNILQRWMYNGNNDASRLIPGHEDGGELASGVGVFGLFMIPKL